jgi:hypothetical protein
VVEGDPHPFVDAAAIAWRISLTNVSAAVLSIGSPSVPPLPSDAYRSQMISTTWLMAPTPSFSGIQELTSSKVAPAVYRPPAVVHLEKVNQECPF